MYDPLVDMGKPCPRQESYRQRLLGPSFARQQFLAQDATANLSVWEFLLYVGTFLIFPLYYVGERISIRESYMVNESVQHAFVNVPFRQTPKSLSWDAVTDLEDVKGWLVHAFPKAVVPAVQTFNIPNKAIRFTNRRAVMEKNADENFKALGQYVVSPEKMQDEQAESDKAAYGAHRSWDITNTGFGISYKKAFDKLCVGGRRILRKTDVPVGDCLRACDIHRDVCRCFIIPMDCDDGTINCSFCELRAYEDNDLVATSDGVSYDFTLPLAYNTDWISYIPKLKSFKIQEKAGYRETTAFVEFFDAQYPSVVQDNIKDTKMLQQVVQDHLRGGFLDRFVAALALDFVTYNENYDSYTWVRIKFQFDAAGVVEKEIYTDTLHIDFSGVDLYDIGGYYVQTTDIVFVGFVLFWLSKEMKELCIEGVKKYFLTVWNWVMLLTIILNLATILVWVRFQSLDSALPYLRNPTTGVEARGIVQKSILTFAAQAEAFITFQRVAGIAFFLQYLMCLSYLRLASPRVGILMDMISRASTAMVCFGVLTMFVFLGFVNYANIQFGSQIKEFGNIGNSFVELFSMMGGKVDLYDYMVDRFPIQGRVFFLIFTLLFYFILVNLNNAILNASYVDAVKEAEQRQAMEKRQAVQMSSAAAAEGDVPLDEMLGGKLVQKLSKMKRQGVNRVKEMVGACVAYAKPEKDEDEELGMHLNLKDTDKKDDEEIPEEDSLTKKGLYILFVIIYVIILLLALQRGSSYQARAAIQDTIDSSTFETSKGLKDANFELIEGPDDALLWLRYAFPMSLFGSSGTLPDDLLQQYNRFLDTYGGEIVPYTFTETTTAAGTVEYTQLVLRNWNVILGQTPVRLTHRLYQMEQNPSGVYVRNSEDRTKEVNPRTANGEFKSATTLEEIVDVHQRKVVGKWCKYGTGFRGTEAWICNLPIDEPQFIAIVSEMYSDGFLTAQSASLVAEFVSFNAQLKIFCLTGIEFWLEPGGTVGHRVNIEALPLEFYSMDNYLDIVRMAMEFIYLCYVVYYIGDEMLEIVADFKDLQVEGASGLQRVCIFCTAFVRHFVLDIFNAVDFTSYVLSILSVYYWIEFVTDELVMKYVQYETPLWDSCEAQSGWWCSDGDVMTAFRGAIDKQSNFTLTASANVIFIFFRLLKFFRYMGRIRVIINSLAGGLKDIVWFFLIFFVVFFSFVLMGYIFFGTHLGAFSTPMYATLNVFEMILGSYNYEKLAKADPTMAGVFFFPFLLLFYYLLMNVFFAIMDKNFQQYDASYKPLATTFTGGKIPSTGGSSPSKIGETFSKMKGVLAFGRSGTQDTMGAAGTFVGSPSKGGKRGSVDVAALEKVKADAVPDQILMKASQRSQSGRMGMFRASMSAATIRLDNIGQPVGDVDMLGKRMNSSMGGSQANLSSADHFRIKESNIRDSVPPLWLLLPTHLKDWAIGEANALRKHINVEEKADTSVEDDIEEIARKSLLNAQRLKETERAFQMMQREDEVEVGKLVKEYLGEVLPQLHDAYFDQNVLAQHILQLEERHNAKKETLDKAKKVYVDLCGGASLMIDTDYKPENQR